MSGSEGLVMIGEAARVVMADAVEVTLGVQASGVRAGPAANEVGSRILNLVPALVARGIAQKDVQTGVFSVVPLYPPAAQASIPSEAPAAAGYHVSAVTRVMLRDVNRAGELVDVAVAAGANGNVGLAFRLQNELVTRAEVLAAAIQDAHAKAAVAAAGGERGLGAVTSVLEELTFPPAGGVSFAGPVTATVGQFGGAPLGNTPLSPCELLFFSRVRVTYSLQ